jgi:hypothetical protein
MTTLEIQKSIIASFANPIIESILNKVVRSLQRLDATSSGIYKGNTWDDICIQVQSSISIYWPLHEEAIEGFIAYELEKLKFHERNAIWFQTDSGKDSIFDELFNLKEKEGIDDLKEPSYDESETIAFLYQKIWEKADKWSNGRLRDYLG